MEEIVKVRWQQRGRGGLLTSVSMKELVSKETKTKEGINGEREVKQTTFIELLGPMGCWGVVFIRLLTQSRSSPPFPGLCAAVARWETQMHD